MSRLSGWGLEEGHTRSNQLNMKGFVLKTSLQLSILIFMLNFTSACGFLTVAATEDNGIEMWSQLRYLQRCPCLCTQVTQMFLLTCKLHILPPPSIPNVCCHTCMCVRVNVCDTHASSTDYSPEGFKYHFN